MTQRPLNILFLLPDQHRPDWLGCNPALPLRTPTLDRLCTDGVRFTQAMTPSPLCSPARACLANGRDYARCGVVNNGQNTPLDIPTYYARLRDAGYAVAGVGKFDLHKPDHDWGLDGSRMLAEYGFTAGIDNEGKGDAIASYRRNGMAARGPYVHYLQQHGWDRAHYAMYEPHIGAGDTLNYPAVTELPDEAYCDNWVAANAERFLTDFPAGRPWHLVVNFVGPHGPFDVTRAMHERWKDAAIPPPVCAPDPHKPSILQRRRYYAAMIENIDTHVGRLLACVAQRGELDRTLIVYSSDHGEMLGDHGRWGKSTWHTASAGIPMIVAGPGIRRNICSDALVSLHDLAATFLDYAGAAPLPDADSLTLRPVLEGTTDAHRPFLRSGLDKWRLLYDGHHKLVTGAGPDPLLFDLKEDPAESRNLAADRPEVVRTLAPLLACC